MGKIFEGIDGGLAQWLMDQPVFFVSTAPLDGAGLINCSPKGTGRNSSYWENARSPISTRPGVASRPLPTCTRMGGSSSCSARSPGRRGSCAFTAGGDRWWSIPPSSRSSQPTFREGPGWACARSSSSTWIASLTRAATAFPSCLSRATGRPWTSGASGRVLEHSRLLEGQERHQHR